jgi:glutathione-independent formaldehyde dehydrogenase
VLDEQGPEGIPRFDRFIGVDLDREFEEVALVRQHPFLDGDLVREFGRLPFPLLHVDRAEHTAGVTSGSTVYIAGAGPVGLAAAHSAQLLGAAVVIVGDLIPERLEQARSFGCETIDVSKGDPKDQIEQILGVPEVDAAVDAVGFEARGHGADAEHEAPATVLNSVMDVTRVAGKLGIPGLYVTGDPGAVDEAAKVGSLSIRIGLGWAKSHSFTTGQCPVMRYHHGLMQMILNGKAQIAKAVNATVIGLDEAPRGYEDFDKGAAKKFVFNPHGLIKV